MQIVPSKHIFGKVTRSKKIDVICAPRLRKQLDPHLEKIIDVILEVYYLSNSIFFFQLHNNGCCNKLSNQK